MSRRTWIIIAWTIPALIMLASVVIQLKTVSLECSDIYNAGSQGTVLCHVAKIVP
jgi:hypothetical protein